MSAFFDFGHEYKDFVEEDRAFIPERPLIVEFHVKGTDIFSWSEIPYGISDLTRNAASRYSVTSVEPLLRGEHLQCCINGCGELLAKRRRGLKPSFCPNHGISMSTKPTYIYQDATRNFIIGKDLPECLSKVEKWRLGFETSEDALSWNVFVGLYALKGLAQAFEVLTGVAPAGEPELYLWGNRVGADIVPWSNLRDVRNELESNINIPTEPDIMLRVPGQAIVLIEAKFGSPNSNFAGKKGRFASVTEFLNRYRCKQDGADPLNRKWISEQKDEQILEQLCRNTIFAHWLASEREQPFVINLVTQKATSDEHLFRQHLTESEVRFDVRRWEDFLSLPIIRHEQASVLHRYLRNKTLNLLPAFGLDAANSASES